MGVGKTTICQQLKSELSNSVFLDGDWCWDASPFHVTEETKVMVVDNICHLLNNFLHCSAYDNVIFCWVMHQQAIIDSIIQELDLANCDVNAHVSRHKRERKCHTEIGMLLVPVYTSYNKLLAVQEYFSSQDLDFSEAHALEKIVACRFAQHTV